MTFIGNDGLGDSGKSEDIDDQLQGIGQDDLQEAEAAEQMYEVAKDSSGRNMTLLLVICIAGLIGVYMMSKCQKTMEPSEQDVAAEQKIDVALLKLVDNDKNIEVLNNTEQMIQAFYDYPANQQVQLDDLQKDPFFNANSASKNGKVVTHPVSKKAKTRAERKEELRTMLVDVKLQSVIQSARGAMCLVNGDMCAKGQVINKYFTIIEIAADSIVLEADGFKYSIKIQ